MTKPIYLVAVDGSSWGRRAAEWAIHLAEKTHATVKLVTVLDWSYLQPMIVAGVAPPVLDKAKEESNTTAKVLTPLVEKYQHLDVNISAELLWGDPFDVIKEQVKATSAVILFVGRQGRSRVVDILLGSVANKLAHNVEVPIVLVP
jgi:nucleotide-binding universal stress UspA family protein